MWPGNLNDNGFGSTLGNTAYDRYNKSIAYSLDNQFEGHFTPGAFDHTVLAGLSLDRVNSQYRNKAGTLNAAADMNCWDSKFTWQTGVMYQFDNGLSPYASYATAFAPNQQTESRSGPLDHTTSEEYELGIKYEPKGWNTAFTASVFDLRKKDDVLYDAAVGDYRQIGASRAKGVELELNSDLSEHG